MASREIRLPGPGFHWLLLIECGQTFCVVYDPDVTATKESWAAWEACTKNVPLDEKPAKREVLETMILGKNGNLGPLIRYYH